MNCPNCGKRCPPEAELCPACGKALPGELEEEKTEAAGSRKAGRRGLWIAVCVLIAAAAAGAVWFAGYFRRQDSGPTLRDMQKVVMTCGEEQLTNAQFSYYYWSEYFYFINTYGGYLSGQLDTSKPLDQQQYDEDTTWQDYMIQQTLDTISNTKSLCYAAKEAGFDLDAEYQQSLEQVLSEFADYAKNNGYTDEAGEGDVESYLRASYGPAADLTSFREYLADSYLSAAYSDELYAQPSFTDQEISDYYDEYAADYLESGVEKNDAPMRTVRMICILPEDAEKEADWEKACDDCQSILTTWESKGYAEEEFATLAITYSQDKATSAAGGLVADVYPGKYAGAVDAWLFDGARKPGDYEVIRTDNSYQIVYISSFSDQAYWQQAAESDLRYETYNNALAALREQYQFQVNRSAIVLAEPENLYSQS